MIKGVGIDILDISDMEKRMKKESFLRLAFTDDERAYCDASRNRAQHYTARFCAKEAYMKATGLGWSNEADFKDIEVVKDKNGRPALTLHNDALTYFKSCGYKDIFVSLSHTKTTATAIVIITG